MLNHKKNRILRRSAALLLIFALLSSTVLLAHGLIAAGSPADADAPDVNVLATLTEGGKYLEVGLAVDSKSLNFQSAGVLLKYDKAKLTPVAWNESDERPNVAAAADAASAWEKTTVLPAKGADKLSGKTALAVELESQGYLYLGSEAAKPEALQQKPPADSWTGETEGEAFGDGKQAQTGNHQTIQYLGKAETPADQATVVRFQVGSKETDVLYTLDELTAALDLVVVNSAENAAETALLQSSGLMVGGQLPLEGVSYIADNRDYTTAGYETAVNFKFLWVADGQTVNSGSGGGDLSNVVPIIFYDWDEKTVLGSLAVDRTESEETIKAQVEQFTQSFLPESVSYSLDPSIYGYDQAYEVPNSNFSPLTEKTGYSFGKWIPYNNEDDLDENGNFKGYTSYGYRVGITDGTNVEEPTMKTEPKAADFSSVPEGGLLVKASYVTNKVLNSFLDTNGNSLNISGDATSRAYTITLEANDRFALTNNYSVTVKIERKNAMGQGVHRCRVPALRVELIPQGGSANDAVFSLVPIDNTDLCTQEVVPNTNYQQIKVTLVDIAEVSNWVSATTSRSNTFSQYSSGESNQNFAILGNVKAVNDGLKMGSAPTTDYINALELDYESKGNPPGYVAPSRPTSVNIKNARLAAAKNNILIAYNEKKEILGSEFKGLTFEEMQEAIWEGKYVPIA